MKMAKRFYRQIGSSELLTELPGGHTMSMGYLTEKLYTESEILEILMKHAISAPSQEVKDTIDSIGSSLGIM